MNPKTNFFFEAAGPWKEAYAEMRKIALSCGLMEELKWGCPCYTLNKKNVVLIHGFKEYCAFLFFKGSLLQDREGMLIQQTENVQASRQIRFTTAAKIRKMKKELAAYIYEAMEVEKAGLKVALKKTRAYPVPEEFRKILSKDKKLKAAFEALTPGRQRGYLLYFSQAKQAKTRMDRIEKYRNHILAGKGLND